MLVRNSAGDMQQADCSAGCTPSSSTSVVTQSYDSSSTLHRLSNPMISSPPSPVPRRVVTDYARQITKKQKSTEVERLFFSYFPCSLEEVLKFATRENTTLEYVKSCAKHLGLIITRGNRGGRCINLRDRISFGLKSGASKLLKECNMEVKGSLFNFGMRIKTGFLQPSG